MAFTKEYITSFTKRKEKQNHLRKSVFSSQSQGIPCEFSHGSGCLQYLCLFGTKCSKTFGRGAENIPSAMVLSFWLTWGGNSQDNAASLQDQAQEYLVSVSLLCRSSHHSNGQQPVARQAPYMEESFALNQG